MGPRRKLLSACDDKQVYGLQLLALAPFKNINSLNSLVYIFVF
jgi:hypothetical protein